MTHNRENRLILDRLAGYSCATKNPAQEKPTAAQLLAALVLLPAGAFSAAFLLAAAAGAI